MKKLIVASLIAVSGLAMAKGSSSPGADTPAINVAIDFRAAPRVLTFDSIRNEIDANGQLLVCLRQFSASWQDPGKCVDPWGRNAWSLAESALPGYKLKSYEFRYIGSSGSRQLILYFSK